MISSQIYGIAYKFVKIYEGKFSWFEKFAALTFPVGMISGSNFIYNINTSSMAEKICNVIIMLVCVAVIYLAISRIDKRNINKNFFEINFNIHRDFVIEVNDKSHFLGEFYNKNVRKSFIELTIDYLEREEEKRLLESKIPQDLIKILVPTFFTGVGYFNLDTILKSEMEVRAMFMGVLCMFMYITLAPLLKNLITPIWGSSAKSLKILKFLREHKFLMENIDFDKLIKEK